MHIMTMAVLSAALVLAGCGGNSGHGGNGEAKPRAGGMEQSATQPDVVNPGRAHPAAPAEPVVTSVRPVAAPPPAARGADGRDAVQPAFSPPVTGAVTPQVVQRRPWTEAPDRENYAHIAEGGTYRARETPVSTFSVDVDTGSYAVVRRMLNEGRLPVRDAVRIEEMINYFDYGYAAPPDSGHPFSVHTELGPNPWNAGTHLLKIGIQGRTEGHAGLPPANLVFLVDVSGSMRSPDKLELLKQSLRLLVARLRAEDRIAIVVYAGASGLVLPATPGDRKSAILAALDGLSAGGSTNGAAGIRLAYQVARENYIENGVNRVLLATDGDFNVGTVDVAALKDLVAGQRASGISLTTLGFGSGNYNDHLMEQIADIGNGNHAYIDRLAEARKVLVGQLAGTLNTIASDVKIQVEFNPAVVSEYRLVGYENRVLRREDFNNDRVDAGEIGAGHNVTALYEIRLAGPGNAPRIDPLRYGGGREEADAGIHGELAWLKLRYKHPGAPDSVLLQRPVQVRELRRDLARTSPDYRFAAAVAGFGQLLRGGSSTGRFGFGDVLELAVAARGTDAHGYRGEFIGLVELAQALATPLSRRGGAPDSVVY